MAARRPARGSRRDRRRTSRPRRTSAGEAERDDAIAWPERVPPSRLRLLDLGTGELPGDTGLGNRHVVDVGPAPGRRPAGGAHLGLPRRSIPVRSTAGLHVVDPVTGSGPRSGAAGLDPRSPSWWRDDGGWHLSYLAMLPPGPVAGWLSSMSRCRGRRRRRSTRNLTAGCDRLPNPPGAGRRTAHRWRCSRTDSTPRSTSSIPGRGGSVRCPHGTASWTPCRVEPLGRDDRRAGLGLATSRSDVHAGSARRPADQAQRHPARNCAGSAAGAQERLSYQASDGLQLDGLLILPRRHEPPRRSVPARDGGARRSLRPVRGPVLLAACSRPGSGSRPPDTRSSCPTRAAARGTARQFAAAVAGPGRPGGVDRHRQRDRPAHRRRGRRSGPARHRRGEPRRVHGGLGDRADRPVRGRGDARRDQRLGDAGRAPAISAPWRPTSAAAAAGRVPARTATTSSARSRTPRRCPLRS